VLRGAGFPADLVSSFAGRRAAAAARECVAIADARHASLAALLAQVRATIAAESTDGPLKTQLRAIERRLRRGRIDVPSIAGDAASWLDGHRARLAAIALQERDAHAALIAAYDEDARAVDTTVSAILADARVREAMLWQSPASLQFARAALARHHGAKRQRASELVARIAQRLAVKNDTYSFFGPVGWAELGDGDGYVRQTTTPHVAASGRVFFEGWAIDALAERFDRDGLTRWWPPRLATGAWVGSDGVYTPRSGPIALSDLEGRVVRASDGVRTPDDIAALVAGAASSPASIDRVFDVLSHLATTGVLAWKVEIASQLQPEVDLERRLERIGDPAVRTSSMASLRSLVDARDRVAACDGDPDRLEPALESLNATFTRLTGRDATRRQGQTYAARGIVYHDCRRDGRVAFGRAFLDRLGPSLTVVLDAVRWLVGEVTLSANDLLRDCHARLRSDGAVVPAEPFFDAAKRTLLADGGRRLFAEIERRFQAAWRDVLGEPLSATPNEIRYDLPAVEARAARAFVPRADGWSLAHHLSPDVLIAADGPAAAARGDFTFVLGEIHCSNTARWSLFAAQHPSPAELLAAVERDAGDRVSVVVQTPKEVWLARMNPLLVPPSFWRYETGADMANGPACRSLPAGSLVAIDDGRVVRLRARDGSFECDALERFGPWLSPKTSEVTGRFRPEAAHLPRVVLGDLTIARESWRMTPADMPFLDDADRIRRFLAVTAWRQAHGLPRFVFYKPSHEPKPVYLDFDSPLYVDVFVRLLKQAGRPAESVRLVEMLPRADQSWLVDASGRRYASELRLVVPVPRRARDRDAMRTDRETPATVGSIP
jgi:hypothetical protein